VEDIKGIKWSALPFDSLTIPAQKKEVIMTVTQSRMGQPNEGESFVNIAAPFNNVIEGKERGINILLQYGLESLFPLKAY
jgi:hypothetical protein